MGLKKSERIETILRLGEMEHAEHRILYQFVVGGTVSVSVAFIVAIMQEYLTVNEGILFLLGFWEFAIVIYTLIKRNLNKIRKEIEDKINDIERMK